MILVTMGFLQPFAYSWKAAEGSENFMPYKVPCANRCFKQKASLGKVYNFKELLCNLL